MVRQRRLFLLLALIIGVCSTHADRGFGQEKNSTRKLRKKPVGLATQIGSAVNWQESFSDAMEIAKKEGKQVFWYVPTLRGSFMDRKRVINWYMLSGPFSWPHIIESINENYVPVKSMPTEREQAQFELLPYKFIEPGFLIINPDESVHFKVDEITTYSPEWFTGLLQHCGAKVASPNRTDELNSLWKSFRNREFDIDVPLPEAGAKNEVEHLLLAGMFKFRNGDHTSARKLWTKASQAQPDHPLAWKAATEAQTLGPFYRGFEVHSNLHVDGVLQAGIKSQGSRIPMGYTEAQAVQHSVDFLLGMQRTDGGWVDSDYDFGGTDSLPNVHAAVTALCGMALLNLEGNPNVENQEQISAAIDRTTAFLLDDKNINRIDRDEILWAFAYKLRFLCRLHRKGKVDLAIIQAAVEDLQNVQSKKGHWYHEYNNSWVTATALCALKEAGDLKAKINTEIIEKGCKALTNDRYQNGAYGYYPRRSQGDNPRGDVDDLAAAAGRMPICDLGLWYWGKLDDATLLNAVQVSNEYQSTQEKALKYDNHTSTYAYGGFFFWYDMRSRAEAISMLQDEDQKQKEAKLLRDYILKIPEFDGCFVDSHELGRCYGTAMALLSLYNLNK